MHISQTVFPCKMSPTIQVSENNSGVFNTFVRVYEQGKTHVYTSAVSASLFGVLKFLETSRSLERATRNLEIATSSSDNARVVLSELERKVKHLALENAVFTVKILLSASKQMEIFTGEIEGNTCKPGFKLHESMYEVLYKNAIFSSHWGLIKLSQISRHLELLTDDLEVFTHEVADPSFQLQQQYTYNVLAISNKILDKIIESDARFIQIKNRLFLQAVGRLIRISKEFEKFAATVETKTATKCVPEESEKRFLDYIQASGIRYALLSRTQRNVVKLFELSKVLENVTKELELYVHTVVDPSFKPDTDPYLNSLIAKSVAYVEYQAKLNQIIVYNTALDLLHHASKQLENVATTLNRKVTHKEQNALNYISESNSSSNKSNKPLAFIRKVTYTSALAGITALLYTSRSLEKINGKELFGDKTATIRKSLVSQSLWFVLQAKNISQSLETVTKTMEASTARICEPGFEKRIKNSVCIASVTAGISVLTRLERTAKLLQATITNLEIALQKEIACKKIHNNSKRDKNCNDEDEESIGRSYKMMNASRDLERLLNELEAFVIDLPDFEEKKPSKHESMPILRLILLKSALVSASVLFKTSKLLEQVTGSLEHFEDISVYVWNCKMEFYHKILSIALWNVNKFTETSRLLQPVTFDLELIARKICYSSVHRKEISVCSRALHKMSEVLYGLQVSLEQKQRKLSLFVSNLLQASQIVLNETHKLIFNDVPEAFYPKCIKFSLEGLQILLVLTEKMKTISANFEQNLNQPKIVSTKPEQPRHSRVSVYDYGRDAIIVLSTWCSNELAEFMRLVESCVTSCEKYLNEIDRFHMEFAKNLHCRLTNPHFTFEFQLQITSSVNCYKTNREIMCSS